MIASFHIPSNLLFTIIQTFGATYFRLLTEPLYKLQLNKFYSKDGDSKFI
jgi:hypothetical protein